MSVNQPPTKKDREHVLEELLYGTLGQCNRETCKEYNGRKACNLSLNERAHLGAAIVTETEFSKLRPDEMEAFFALLCPFPYLIRYFDKAHMTDIEYMSALRVNIECYKYIDNPSSDIVLKAFQLGCTDIKRKEVKYSNQLHLYLAEHQPDVLRALVRLNPEFKRSALSFKRTLKRCHTASKPLLAYKKHEVLSIEDRE